MLVDTKASIKLLTQLLDKHETTAWEIGDLLVRMIDVEKQILQEIAARYVVDGKVPQGRSKARLSQFYNNAKRFPVGVRRLDVAFDAHEAVRVGADRIEKNAAKEGFAYKVPIQKHLDRIKAKRCGRGFSRAITKDMACEARNALGNRKQAQSAKPLAKMKPGEIIDGCHLGDYVKTLALMHPASIQILFMDPPYAHFLKFRNGAYDMSASAATVTDCANADEPNAIKTTCEAFALATTRLRKDGVIILWQSGRYLRPQIVKAIEDAGFIILMPFVWEKPPQAGDNHSAISISTEVCYVIQRASDHVTNLALNHPLYHSRKQVWNFAPVNHDAATVNAGTHAFEKPDDWNELVLFKFSSENDIVFDCFGASGSMSAKCLELNRRFVFCELHPVCFKQGEARIEEARIKFGTPNRKVA